MTTGQQPRTTDHHVALLGGWNRPAEAGVPSRAVHIAAVGGSKLDLTGSDFPEGGSTVTSISFVGGADVKVPRGTRVELRHIRLLGGRSVQIQEPRAYGPVLRLRVFRWVGGVDIHH